MIWIKAEEVGDWVEDVAHAEAHCWSKDETQVHRFAEKSSSIGVFRKSLPRSGEED
jgi:hypothetical protein